MTCNLDVLLREACREFNWSSERCRDGDHVRAVNQPGLSENLELSHCCLELGHHAGLVVCAGDEGEHSEQPKEWYIRTDHVLPEAGSAGILRDGEVGLQTHLSVKRREDLARLRAVAREQGAFEKYLQEDLGIAKKMVLVLVISISYQ